MLDTHTRLRSQPISRAAFAPFGRLLEMGSPAVAVNQATALRHDVDAFRAADVPQGFRLITSIYDVEARTLPPVLGVLERHPNSAQLIMPLGGSGHLVAVCLSGADGRPDLASLTAFRCSASQGVIYPRGLWHHPIAALGTRTQFLVQSWQDASDANCEIVSIAGRGIVVGATG